MTRFVRNMNVRDRDSEEEDSRGHQSKEYQSVFARFQSHETGRACERACPYTTVKAIIHIVAMGVHSPNVVSLT